MTVVWAKVYGYFIARGAWTRMTMSDTGVMNYCEAMQALYSTTTSPKTLHSLYGPQDESKTALQWWDRMTSV